MAPVQEPNGDHLGKFFDPLYNNGSLSELIRITSLR